MTTVIQRQSELHFLKRHALRKTQSCLDRSLLQTLSHLQMKQEACIIICVFGELVPHRGQRVTANIGLKKQIAIRQEYSPCKSAPTLF